MRRFAALAAGLASAGAAFPAAASAHGLVGRADLPILPWLFGWAAAVVLIVSFLALAVLWPQPRLEETRSHRLLTLPRWVDPVCGLVGIAAFAVVLYSAWAGTALSTQNLAPTFVYVIFWVGFPGASALFGDVFRAFSPWRALARGVAWSARRVARGAALPEPLPYPDRLGRWPAAATILAFGWLELVFVNRSEPAIIGARGRLRARAAHRDDRVRGRALERARRRVRGAVRTLRAALPLFSSRARAPPARAARRSAGPDRDSRDGRAPVRRDRHHHLRRVSRPDRSGTACFPASRAPSAISDWALRRRPSLRRRWGFSSAWRSSASLYAAGVGGMRTVEPAGRARPRRTLRPLADPDRARLRAVAHYFSLLAYQGQAMGYLVSDPLGHGANLFGTHRATIDYAIVSATGIWYVQVGALVLGHVGGLPLAHHRALVLYRDARDAVRSQA